MQSVNDIAELTLRIERKCEHLFGSRTAMVWINIPVAKTLVNYSRLMKYLHGVGFVGMYASESK